MPANLSIRIKDKTDSEFMEKLLRKDKILEDLRYQVLSFKNLLLGNNGSLLDDWIIRTLAIGKA